MKKILLLIAGVLAFAFPATVSALDNLLFAAETDFPVNDDKNTYNYWLIHCDDYNATKPTFYCLKSTDTNNILTTEPASQEADQSGHKGVFIVNTKYARLHIEKGSYVSETKSYNYKLNFNKSNTTYTYLQSVTDNGEIQLGPKDKAAEVQIEFKYGKYATIHYQGKELQFIDNKIYFAETTGKEENKVYLFISVSKYPSSGVGSTSISISPSTYSPVVNTENHTFTATRSSSSAAIPGIEAEGEQPSQDYSISGSSVTILKGAAPGKYKFTA